MWKEIASPLILLGLAWQHLNSYRYDAKQNWTWCVPVGTACSSSHAINVQLLTPASVYPPKQPCRTLRQFVINPVNSVAKFQLQLYTGPGVISLQSATEISLPYSLNHHLHSCLECTTLCFTFLSLNLPLLLKWEAVCKRLMFRHQTKYSDIKPVPLP